MPEVPDTERCLFSRSSYDIVVIGAGPAGASAAQAAAAAGAEVLMVDRRQRVGEPVRCAEWVSEAISRDLSISSESIRQRTTLLVVHLPSEKTHEMTSPGFMVDRSRFDKEIVLSAAGSGARISIGTEAIGLSPQGIALRRGTEHGVIGAKVIIGADGGHSSVAAWLGLPPMKKIVALQYETSHPRPQSEAEVFFERDFVCGYGWFFPKGSTANLGLGIIPEKASLLEGLLDRLLRRLETRKGVRLAVLGKTGGSIPCGGARPRTVFGNVLLAGDAAGHTHPITGAGILNAVLTGRMAGRVAAEAVKKCDLGHLENYEVAWRELLASTLSYGALKRRWLEESWPRPDIDFEALIRSTWTGFKEYHQGRRECSRNLS
jgi:digeranylgeranylglycerophospholipid reductase